MSVLRHGAIAAAALLGLAAGSAAARPVTDCPNRDTPFSVDSPLIDLLLSPAARKIVEDTSGRSLANGPPRFVGTTPPTFSAILSLRKAGMFTGLKDDQMPAIDAKLRALPVTAADRVARCARYDNDVPAFRLTPGKPHLLLFEKINGFKDEPSVNAAHAAFVAMAGRKGWDIVATQSGGAFNPATLRRFDAVIWNNISGDVLTLAQRKAFQQYLAGGGSFVAVHGSAGDPTYFWDWYPDKLLGARFLMHPMNPQFQEARIAVNKDHPLAKALPAEWRMTDEWYSFSTNPRSVGAKVVLTLDESTYKPVGMMGIDLRMGDHPLAWTNCIGRGKMFYSAIGHRPETYSQPEYVALLEAALGWAVERKACS
ncbi:MAG: ThuA domain-containing protein [Sphingomonadales bacterium]|nr:ThuA domain-containing protein [Sphingomonadales bacterium]